MRIEGRLLTFDTVVLNDHYFSKDCKIDIPKSIPIVDNFDFSSPEKIIGFANVKRDNYGLILSGKITNGFYTKDLLEKAVKGWGLGGYFNKIDSHDDNGIRVIDKANLKACAIVPHPCSKEWSFEIIEEEKER